jgi:hypothetical protein
MDSNAREPELQPLFNVGYKVIDFKYRKDGQEQTITVAVWYPTAAPSKSHHYEQYVAEKKDSGHMLRGATHC